MVAVNRLIATILILFAVSTANLWAQEQRVIKVLPHLMDKQGRHATSPNLFERDAYQAWLRENPDEQSGVRYDIQWQSYISGDYELKLELLGKVFDGKPKTKTVTRKFKVKNRRRKWDVVKFEGDEFRQFGQIVAWRVSIWQGDEMVAKKQSFLWE